MGLLLHTEVGWSPQATGTQKLSNNRNQMLFREHHYFLKEQVANHIHMIVYIWGRTWQISSPNT